MATKKETFLVQGMHCVSCALTIEQAIKKVPGVKSVLVNMMSEKAVIEYEEPATPELMKAAVAKTGYVLVVEKRNNGRDESWRACRRQSYSRGRT